MLQTQPQSAQAICFRKSLHHLNRIGSINGANAPSRLATKIPATTLVKERRMSETKFKDAERVNVLSGSYWRESFRRNIEASLNDDRLSAADRASAIRLFDPRPKR